MNQQELEELLKQIAPNHDPGRLDPSETTETVEVPGTPTYEGQPDVPKTKKQVRVLTWVDRGTGLVLRVQVNPENGTYTKISQGIDPKEQGAPATTPAQVAADEKGVEVGTEQKTDAEGNVTKVTTYRRPDGSTYERTDSATQAPKPAQRSERPVQIGGKNLTEVTTTDPATGKTRVFHVDPATGAEVQPPGPAPQTISAPPNQKWISQRNAAGEIEFIRNQAYEPPSQIVKDPDTGTWIQITEDENGKPVSRRVTAETTIKPAELPVLQAKYGEVAQGLGALAADLNRKRASGEITEKERSDAFAAGHQQATTQIAEINSILDNSRAVWSQEISQRGQTLSDTAGRRTAAVNMLQNAVSTGGSIATSAGPGHGAEIAGGVGALLNIGQRYAEGVGGMRESPEIPIPKALQQARDVSLPGFGGSEGQATATPASDVMRTSDVMLATPAPAATPSGADVAAGAAATAAQSKDAFGGLGIGTEGGSGTNPLVQQMQQQLMGSSAFAGSPVAMGGAGVWDPQLEAQRMGGSGDASWEEAVKRAVAASGQQLNDPNAGYRRYFQ